MTTLVDPAAAGLAEAELTGPAPGADFAAAAADRFATLVRGRPPAHVEDLLDAVEQAVTHHDRVDLATVVHEALKSDGKPAMAVGYRELSTVSAPPVTKHFPHATRIELPGPLTLDHRFDRVLRARGSRRDIGGPPVTLAELATILRGSYGVRKVITAYNTRRFPLRVIPTAGGLQSPELYVVVNDVPGLAKGLYHYDAVGPRGDGVGPGLELLSRGNMRRAVVRAAPLQEWIHHADVVIVMTTVLDRLLWKYGPRCYRYAHMDIGYLSAHVYLVAAALGLRTSAVSGFEDEVMNRFLRVDGSREFVQLLMPIGRRPDGPAPVAGLGGADNDSDDNDSDDNDSDEVESRPVHVFVVLLPLWFAVGGAVATAATGMLSRGVVSVGRVVGIVQLGFILTAIAVLWWGSDAATGPVTFWRFGWSTLLWCVAGAVVGWLCMPWEIGVARVLAVLVPRGRNWQAVTEGDTPALASLDVHRTGWLVLGVGFAVAEEVLWRGLARNVLDGAGWSELDAVVLLAVLFGLCHAWFGLRGVIAKTGEGLAWAGLVLAAGAVAPAVVSHTIFQVLVLRRLGRQRGCSRRVAPELSGSDDIGAPARESSS